MTQQRSSNLVQSAINTLEIIEIIAKKGPVGVTEIADDLDLHKSTAYNYLTTLEKNRYLIKEDKKFRLSSQFLRYGSLVRNHPKLYKVAKSEIEQLASDTGEIVVLVTEEHKKGVIIGIERGGEAVEFNIYPGKWISLAKSAAGKAILAYFDESKIESLLDTQVSSTTQKDGKEIREELVQIRKRGIAFDQEQSRNGLNAAAVPIKDETGTIFGAISVIAPKSRLKGDRLEKKLPEQLLNSANVIEINMRYS
jgi:DNA-binding IclR family transcriptional regulator